MSIEQLTQAVLRGEMRAVARLLTYVENEREGTREALTALFPHTGRAWVIGITGAPGTGKSTLVAALAKGYRAQGRTVGIVAVDPSSPFTGGAILGDRIRMRDLSDDDGVFIRSMATRGQLGGLARTTRDAIRVLDAAGFSVILVETVGAGQSEVEVARTAQTTIVVEAPGLGDQVQSVKAGILEIADILVVNKADKAGADNAVATLRMMLEMGHPAMREQMAAHHGRQMRVTAPTVAAPAAPLWVPPVVRTVASEGTGVAELIEAIEQHRAHLTDAHVGAALEKQRLEMELYDRLRATLLARLLHRLPPHAFEEILDQLQTRAIDPQTAVEQMLRMG
jgi:LAO/AO transport system kinase